jgi:hypothetical protein
MPVHTPAAFSTPSSGQRGQLNFTLDSCYHQLCGMVDTGSRPGMTDVTDGLIVIRGYSDLLTMLNAMSFGKEDGSRLTKSMSQHWRPVVPGTYTLQRWSLSLTQLMLKLA